VGFGCFVNNPYAMTKLLNHSLLQNFLHSILANCLTHARRKFVELLDRFPDDCAYVIEQLGKVYHFDELAKEQGLSDKARLIYHQEQSGPVMDELESWCKQQLEERIVEPNSGLGKAINYMLKHWKKLTRFLQIPGAPLDNNLCERALKYAIINRKNALFYRTQRGAYVGDLFMSLIHTCQLAGTNPLAYITWLLKNSRESKNPRKTTCLGIIPKLDLTVGGTPTMPAGSPVYHPICAPPKPDQQNFSSRCYGRRIFLVYAH
jgi:hypothetical protein